MGSQGPKQANRPSPKMTIEKIYVYPIKSLRGTELDSAALTKHGFTFDRRFMLLRPSLDEAGHPCYDNVTVTSYNEMVFFHTEISMSPDGDAEKGRIRVTFPRLGADEEKTQLVLPLLPDTRTLARIRVMMHRSPTRAFRMPDQYNEWFSTCFGFDVVLAYLGDNRRKVLMSADETPPLASPNENARPWLSALATKASSLLAPAPDHGDAQITFADLAPYLVVSSKSMDDVHRRLPDGVEMDISKFRPNVIISGAHETWEEDYWAELSIAGQPVWNCVHNCARCRSINIDYDTGKQGTNILKELSRDRRVDAGTKWSPVFGRYSFLHRLAEGRVLKVGDEVDVSRRNTERTKFDWEGLCTT